MFEERKGISTFIATLLLMVLAVSAGVVIYAYTMGYMGGFGGANTLGSMSLDEASLVAADGEIVAYLRNTGKTTLLFTEDKAMAYVDGTLATIDYTVHTSPISIPQGDVLDITVTYAGAQPGNTYNVKLIADDNTQITFSVKAK